MFQHVPAMFPTQDRPPAKVAERGAPFMALPLPFPFGKYSSSS